MEAVVLSVGLVSSSAIGMGACGSTEERQRQEPEQTQRRERQAQLALSRVLELWLTDPPPRRKINARAIETIEEVLRRLARELELEKDEWSFLDLEFSGAVLSHGSTLEQEGLEAVGLLPRVLAWLTRLLRKRRSRCSFRRRSWQGWCARSFLNAQNLIRTCMLARALTGGGLGSTRRHWTC